MSDSSSMPKIGKYSVVRKISEGASGVVHLVESELGQFALKLLKASDMDAVIRFRRESSTLARLNHKNLAKVFDVGEFQNLPYLVMEFVEGDAFSSLISGSKSGLDEKIAIEIVSSVAKALTELHKNNLVHRDIKPANILFTSQGLTKLIDLGLVGDIDEIKTQNALVGTPLYCSPEQSRILKRPVDFRSDLYSLGVTFFEAVTGQLPFNGSVSEIIQRHASTNAANVREIKIEIRRATAAIIAKMLAKDPDDRYQSAQGLLHDISRIEEIDKLIEAGKDADLGAKDTHTLTTTTKFVDRTVETAVLRNNWLQVAKNNPSAVIVSGPSGSGKSRLCEEFVQSVLANDILVLRGKCQFFDSDLPFAPIREALDTLFEDVFSLNEEVRDLHLERLTKAGQGYERFLLKMTASFKKIFDQKIVEGNDGQITGEEKDLFFANISRFFSNLCTQWRGVIFLVDDLQWLDQSSLELLNRIFGNASNCVFLLLGTCRDDQDSVKKMQTVNEFLGGFTTERLSVKPFSKMQMSTLVSNFLGADDLNPKITEFINSKSSGNPFVAIEFLRSGIEQNLVFYKENTWQINEEKFENISLSENVYQMILKRIENTSQESKEILKTAAIYGNIFKGADLAKIKNIKIDDLNSSLKNFQDLGLIERQSTNKWKFAHDKVLESIRSSLSKDETRKIAYDLAKFFESKEEKFGDEVFALARYYSVADRDECALQWIAANNAAGVISSANFAFSEGYRYFSHSYNLIKKFGVKDTNLLSQVTSKLSVCATMMGDWDLATECSNIYCQLSESNQNCLDSLTIKVWGHRNQGDLSTGWDYFKTATEVLGEKYPWYLQLKLLNIVFFGTILYLCEVLRIGRLPGNTKRTKYGLVNADTFVSLYYDAYGCSEYLDNQIDSLLTALKLIIFGKQNGHKVALGLGYKNLASSFRSYGRLPVLNAFCERADALCMEIADPSVVAKIQAVTFAARADAGLISTTDAEWEAWLVVAKKYLPPIEYGHIANLLAYRLIVDGKHAKALELVSRTTWEHRQNIKKLGELSLSNALHMKWLMLQDLGRLQESQQAKKDALQVSNRLRFIPNASKSALVYEILSKRYMEEADDIAFELMETGLRRASRLSGLPALKFFESSLVYVCLLLLEKADHPDRIYSLKRKFKRAMMHLNFTSFNPYYKINYYYLLARYQNFKKYSPSLEKWYENSEKIASTCENARILFDIHRDRARIAEGNGNTLGLTIHAQTAFSLAERSGWVPSANRLIAEFNRFNDVLSVSKGVDSESIGSMTMMKSTIVAPIKGGSGKKQQANATLVSNSRSTGLEGGGTQTAMAGGAFEEARFVDALLKVSTAFVESFDLAEQSSRVLTEIVKLFAAERGFVFLKSDSSEELNVLSGKNSDGTVLKDLKGFSSTIVKKVVTTGKPVIVTGTEEGEALGSESAVLHNLRSIMATPLCVRDKVLGAVYLDSSLTKGLFTQGDIELFSTLANHISVAFELSQMANIQLEKANLKREIDVQRAVAMESQKVKVMVDNMQQALFSVTDNGTIIEPVSKYTERVFGYNVVGKNVMDSLFKDLATKKEQLDGVKSAMSVVFGGDELQWDLISDSIPRKVTFHNDVDRTLRLQPSPIWNEQNELEKILFVVEDVTELELLTKEVGEQRRQTAIVEEILSENIDDITTFLEGSKTFITRAKEQQDRISKSDFGVLLRDLHTLKGNARLYKMKLLSEQVHESESNLLGLSDTVDSNDSRGKIVKAEIEKIEITMSRYVTLIERLFAHKVRATSSKVVNELAVQELKERFKIVAGQLSQDQSTIMNLAIDRLSYMPIADLVHRFNPMIQDVATQLGKKVGMTVSGEALTDLPRFNLLQECLLHLLRNSVDHGLETVEERLSAGKPDVGTISVECKDDFEAVTITISDDGRGIDATKVLSRAIEKALLTSQAAQELTEEEKINLIFLPGFSTKETATDISGRGIGMDVVKTNVEKLGGSIKIKTTLGQGSLFIISFKQGHKQLAA